jgi:hypothetical protein
VAARVALQNPIVSRHWRASLLLQDQIQVAASLRYSALAISLKSPSNVGTAAHLAIFCLYRLTRVEVALVVSREEFESEPMW